MTPAKQTNTTLSHPITCRRLASACVSLRQLAEGLRQLAEGLRQLAEGLRQLAEGLRQLAMDTLISTLTTLNIGEDTDTSRFLEFVAEIEDPRIVLLRQKEVVQWLFGDLSFLPEIEKKNKTADMAKYKALEDKWGQGIMKMRRVDLRLEKQWTNRFGEYICEEIYTLLGKVVSKPVKKEHYQPDLEVEDAIIEAKAGTYYTGGTAGEKILGCPFKYAEVPDLYGKPLKILCMGGAEKVCRECYGNLPGTKCSPQKSKFLNFFRENRIEYIGATDIIRKLRSLRSPQSSPQLSPRS